MSIIDGACLCKSKRYHYGNVDMADSGKQLVQGHIDNARSKIIVNDAVFSTDSVLAPLNAICDLGDKHNVLIMINECHAIGFIGKTRRVTLEVKIP